MLKKIEVKNLRNHDQFLIENDKEILIISGENSTGKTTILEAIYTAINKKSFRTNELKDLIKRDTNSAYVKLEINNQNILNIIEHEISSVNETKINGVRSTWMQNKNILKPFIIEQRVLTEFKYSKTTRQKFIDSLISNNVGIYSKILAEFKKTYEMFREVRETNEQILKETLAKKMNELEIEIINFRKEFIEKINDKFNQLTKLNLGSEISIRYENAKEPVMNISEILRENKTINKDNFVFYQDDEEVYKFKSQGEIRMMFILFIVSIILITLENDETPVILLLDDIFSNLDQKNIEKIIKILSDKRIDSIITTPNINMIWDESIDCIKIVKIGEQHGKQK